MRLVSKRFTFNILLRKHLKTFLVQNSVLDLKIVNVNNCICLISKGFRASLWSSPKPKCQIPVKINKKWSVKTSEKHEKIKKHYCIKRPKVKKCQTLQSGLLNQSKSNQIWWDILFVYKRENKSICSQIPKARSFSSVWRPKTVSAYPWTELEVCATHCTALASVNLQRHCA